MTVTDASVTEGLLSGALVLGFALAVEELAADGDSTELDTGVDTGPETGVGGKGADSVDEVTGVELGLATELESEVVTGSDTDVGGKGAGSVPVDVGSITGVELGLAPASGVVVVPPSTDVVVVTWVSVGVGGGF